MRCFVLSSNGKKTSGTVISRKIFSNDMALNDRSSDSPINTD